MFLTPVASVQVYTPILVVEKLEPWLGRGEVAETCGSLTLLAGQNISLTRSGYFIEPESNIHLDYIDCVN